MKKLLLTVCVMLGLVSFDARAVDVIYQGQVPYTTTNPAGTVMRTPADRASDHGVSIVDFGAARNNTSADSSAAIQSAIDACYHQTGCRNISCPDGSYAIYQSIFLDPPGSLRGGAPWVATTYQQGDIVTQSGTYYRSTINNNTNTPPGTGWASTPPVLYNAGSTYSIGNTVIFNGIPWISLVNSNTGNTPNLSVASWKQTFQKGNINANWGASFSGEHGAVNGSTGCKIFMYGNVNAPGMWIYGNGMVVDGINLQQQQDTTSQRCQFDPSLIAFALAGGSASATTIRNSSAANFYAGYMTAVNGDGNVDDSNYLERVDFSNTCYGAYFPQTQNFLNTIINSRIAGRFGVYATQNVGISIYGGNYSQSGAEVNTLGMGTTTMATSGPYTLTTTLAADPGGVGTWPDPSLTNAACTSTRSDYPQGCMYDVFIIVTPSFGAIPFVLKRGNFDGYPYQNTNGYNPSTHVLQLELYNGFSETWQNWWIPAAQSEIQASTTIYAVEVPTTFSTCGGNVESVHIENSSTTRFINSLCSFGLRPSWFKDIYINADPSYANKATPPVQYPRFLAANTFPTVAAIFDLHVDGLQGGTLIDRVTLYGGRATSITMENSTMAFNLKSGFCILPSYSYTDASNTQCGIGARGLGVGLFGSSMGGGATTSLASTFADYMRGGMTTPPGGLSQNGGPGSSPFWGVRPAPWSSPCVTPAQFGNIPPTGTLPAITSTGAGFVGSLDGTTGILTVSSSTGLAVNTNVYGEGIGYYFTLNSQIDATHWQTNATNMAYGYTVTFTSKRLSTMQFTVPYPLLWGGQNYRVCDGYNGWTRSGTISNSFYSAHKFYSYGQPITTTINPALAWSLKRNSPALYLDPSTLKLMFPGLILQLTCNSVTKDEMVVEVNQILGYVRLMDAVQNTSPFTSDFGVDCVGGAGGATLTLGQPAYVATQF